MKSFNNHRGVSIIAAIFIIVILAFMGVMFLSMVNTASFTAVNDLQSAQALYVAEGGLERTTNYLLSPTITERLGLCNSAAFNAALLQTPLGLGQFTVTGTPVYPAATTLNGLINAAATVIPVTSDPTVNYPLFGRIMIDREAIDYTGRTNAPNSFTGAVRGRAGTFAVQHATGTRVGQDQCTVISQGGIPNLILPLAKRQLTEGIQLQEGWIVGAIGGVGNQPLYVRFNGTAWNLFPPASIANRQLNSVSMLSYAEGWAVGAAGGIAGGCPNTNARIFRWDGANWQCVASPSTLALNSVFMVSSSDGWAVGAAGAGVPPCTNNMARILRYAGGAWVCVASTSPQTLNSVFMLDTNGDGIADDGWAVGAGTGAGGHAAVVRWNNACGGVGGAGTWNFCPNAAVGGGNFASNSVFMISATDGWAVGASNGTDPVVLRWNNPCGGVGGAGTWNACPNASVANVNNSLMSVYMVSATDGWAVGLPGTVASGARPHIQHWDGTTWSLSNSGLGLNTALNGVFCVATDDCWAVGAGGLILHWNGTAWSIFSNGVYPALQKIYVIGPKQQPQAAWQEVFQ